MKIRMLLGALAALSCCPTPVWGQTGLTPDEALQALVAGNERFVAGSSERPPLGEGVRRSLRGGQSPFAVVVTSADSRVPPEHLFNAGLGELVVVRVTGQVCDPESLAGIEHAVADLGVPLVVVMAHSDCTAIATLAAERQYGGFAPDEQRRPFRSPALGRVLERLEPALRRAQRQGYEGADFLYHAQIENAHETVAQCMRRSPTLRELVRLRRLRMVAAHYDVSTGLVDWLPERPVTPEQQEALESGPAAAPTPPAMPPHVALSMLQAGHRRFLNGTSQQTPPQLGAERRLRLEHGQRPFAAVLTCTDSRVAPEHLFDAGLGELYVVRVPGNVVSDEALASLEHAFGTLGCGLLIVMGHQNCHVVETAVESPNDPHHSAAMRKLLLRLEPSVARATREHGAGKGVVERTIELNALRAVEQVRSRSALVRQLEGQGSLGMVAVSYQLGSGDLRWLAQPATEEAEGHIAGQGHGHEAGNQHADDAHGGQPSHGAHHGHVAQTAHEGQHPHDTHDHEMHGVVFDDPQHSGPVMATPPGGAHGATGHETHGAQGHDSSAHGEPARGAHKVHGEHDVHDHHDSHGAHGGGRGHKDAHAHNQGDAHGAEHAGESDHGDDEKGADAKGGSKQLLSTILIGLMVATSGVGILILLQRRRM